MRRLLPLLLAAGCAQPPLGTRALAQVTGTAVAPIDGVLGLGDIDGDGFGDALVLSSQASPTHAREGRVALHRGGPGGVLSGALWTLDGGAAGAELGAAATLAGDVDGDGTRDLALGVPGRGEVWLLAGADLLSGQVTTTLSSGEAGDRFGASLAGAGDTDGDGVSGLLVGAPDAGAGAGRLDLFDPPSGAATRSWAGTPAEQLGASLAPLAAVGQNSWLAAVGAPGYDGDHGRLLRVPPAAGALDELAVGEAGARLGEALVGPGDIDGDADADLVSATSAGLGALALFPSAAAPPQVTAGALDAELGAAVAPAGDVDGDGRQDLFVTAGPVVELWRLRGGAWDRGAAALPFPGAALSASDVDGDGRSELLVVEGAGDGALTAVPVEPLPALASEPVQRQGEQAGDRLGWSVTGAGDTDADGLAELAAGAPFRDGSAGLVERVAGADPTGPATGVTITAAPNARSGDALAGGGDADGDGLPDLLVGAPGEGAAYLLSGAATTASWSWSSPTPASRAGAAVALADVDGDGLHEVFVGAPDDGSGGEGAVLGFDATPAGLPSAPSWQLPGALAGASLGESLINAGDVDGDGRDELFAGAPGGDGALWLLGTDGAGGALAVEWSSSGAGGASLGSALARAGDLDGDGLADLAACAAGSGELRILRGGTPPTPAWTGADRCGVATSLAGLMTTSGPALAVTLPGQRALDLLWFDAAGGLAREERHALDLPDGRWALASAGDVDGDGAAELLLGAPFADGAAGATAGALALWWARQDPVGVAPRASVLPGARALAWTLTHPADPSSCPARTLQVEVVTAGQSWGAGTLHAVTAPCGAPAVVIPPPPTIGQRLRWRARVVPAATVPRPASSPWRYGGVLGEAHGVHLRGPCAADTDGDGLCDADDGDDDDDGDPDSTDCAPLDPSIHHGATELPGDDVDEDCSGAPDELCFPDEDGDGYGVAPAYLAPLGTCAQSDDAADCDDSESAVHPGAEELCDGLDSDCDGVTPDDEEDADGDGQRPCGGDCDDTSPDTWAGAVELFDCLDNDCDGSPGANELFDGDRDGDPACSDCDDSDPLRRHGFGDELCDGRANDCDRGEVPADERDEDNDGWLPCGGDCDDHDAATWPGAPGEVASSTVDRNCDGLAGGDDVDGDGYGVADGDCDDANATVHPGQDEACDRGVDTDCDGSAAPGEGVDGDGDGFTGCEDCADGDPSVYPGAEEICDGRDSNCDGLLLDPGSGGDVDLDGDGVPLCAGDCDDANPLVAPGRGDDCSNGLDDDCDGSVDEDLDADADGVGTCDGDCDDADPSRHPEAAELCDGVDQDCDGAIDEDFDADADGFTPCGPEPWDCDDHDADAHPGAPAVCDDLVDNDCLPGTAEWIDADGDGVAGCPQPGGDCDEADGTVFPGAAERCDFQDNDCDGLIDEDLDTDGDGWTSCHGDCDEGLASVYEGAPELCDGLDNDCDGRVDPDCVERLDYFVPPGCTCDSADPSQPSWLALLVLIAWRRRP